MLVCVFTPGLVDIGIIHYRLPRFGHNRLVLELVAGSDCHSDSLFHSVSNLTPVMPLTIRLTLLT